VDRPDSRRRRPLTSRRNRSPLSTVPVWDDGNCSPRHLVLRVYAVASAGGYSVMPGVWRASRRRSTPGGFHAERRRQQGHLGFGDGPTSQLSLLRPSTNPLDVSRATFDLPSRVADNLFWLGRYTERVEPAVRVARAILPRLFQESDLTAMAGVAAGQANPHGAGLHSPGRLEPSNNSLGFARAGSARHDLRRLRRATAFRPSIHRVRGCGMAVARPDFRRRVAHPQPLDLQLSAPPAHPNPSASARRRRCSIRPSARSSAFSGMVMESMTRGDGWRFLDIGRRIERAAQMVDLIRHGLGFECEADSGQLEVLLEIADSSITYRSRYLTSMQPDLVLDLLLLDEANPRSVAYQLARLREHIDRLPGEPSAHTPRAGDAHRHIAADRRATGGSRARIDEYRFPEGWRGQSRDLLNRLTADLRLAVGNPDAPILQPSGPLRASFLFPRPRHVTPRALTQPLIVIASRSPSATRKCTCASRRPARQRVLDHDLTIVPMPEATFSHKDYFGNDVTYFSIHEPHQTLTISASQPD
jgi:uncharacterized alpha-E superfamily protein